jgi:3-deoxy-7-phosphoheptulonate synthase
MIIVMEPGAPQERFEAVCHRVEALGYRAYPIVGVERTVVACVGHEDKSPLQPLESMAGVEAVIPILKPYKLVSREWKKERSVLDVAGIKVGGPELVVMAGPCSVETEESVLEVARAVKADGAQFLRGGAFKPRTSPYAFQGLGEDGLKILRAAADETGLKIVTELVSPADTDLVCQYTDMIQIGARNVQNFALLRCAGASGKPVLLKRGMATTIEEYLMAAEYLMAEGNPNVILCERGIRTFETSTRFTLDLNAIPVIRSRTHLPVIVDPSHGTGHWQYVAAMSKAAIAAGADGLAIEVHQDPANASSDGGQSLKPAKFTALMDELRRVAAAVDRTLPAKQG